MKIGLLLATLGRTVEVERLLTTLSGQTHQRYELVVIDQNPDDRLKPILENFSRECTFMHLRSAIAGLSRARNIGMKALSPDVEVVAFPDDDCWYPKTLLAKVADLLALNDDIDGLSGICSTKQGNPRGRWATKSALIDKYNIFGRCISFTMFLRKALVDRIGPFDESMGLAADVPWPGAEDFDYLLRAVTTKPAGRVLYSREFKVLHDDLPTAYQKAAMVRRYNDGKGFGHFLRKHHYPRFFMFYYASRYIAGASVCYLTGTPLRLVIAGAHLPGLGGGTLIIRTLSCASSEPIF